MGGSGGQLADPQSLALRQVAPRPKAPPMPFWSRSRASASVRLAVLALLTTLAACGDKKPGGGPDPTAPATVERVDVVRPDTITKILADDTLTVTATVVGSNGSVLTDRTITWTSSNSGVLESLGGGLFLAVSEGQATLTATADGRSGSVLADVIALALQDNAIQADSVLRLVSDAAELASGNILRFTRTSDTTAFAVGDVIFGSEGGGFGRVITGVQSDGNDVVLTTRIATLPELVEEAVVTIDEDITFEEALAANGYGASAFAMAPPQGVSVTPDGRVIFDNAALIFSASASRGGASLSVTVNGSATPLLGPAALPGTSTVYVDGKVKWNKFPPLRRLYFNAAAAMDMNVSITTAVSGNLSSALGLEQRKQIFRYRLTSGMAGPVQYSVYLKLEAYATILANAQASVTSSMNLRAGVQPWLSWKHNEGWKNGAFQFGNAALAPPLISGQVETGVRFGMEPTLEIVFFEGLANSNAGFDAFFQGSVGATPYWWTADAKFQLDMFLRATIDAWGVANLAEFELRLEDLWNYPIGSTGGPLARLDLSPSSASIERGKTRQMSGTAFTLTGGVSLGTPQIDWSATPASVLSVNSSGLVTAVGVGSGTVRGTIRGTVIAKEATITVTEPSPDPALRVGSCISLDGSSCTTSNPEITQGSAFYLIYGADNVATGSAVCGVQIAIKHPFTGATTTYTTSGSRCLGTQEFVVDANRPVGSYQITVGPASASGYQTAAAVNVPFRVTERPVAAVYMVSVSPSSSSVAAGGTVQLTARAQDQSGNEIPGKTFSWTSSNAEVASVTSSGLVLASIPGSTTITATTDGVSGSASVTVTGASAPTVTARSPDGSGVSIGTAVTVVFSEAMSNSTSVTVSGASGTTTWSGDRTVATFQPSAPLTEFGTNYTVSVSGSSEAGGTLAPYGWTFTTSIIDEGYYYRIVNLAESMALDTPEYGDGVKRCELRTPENVTGQSWYFTPAFSGYTMRNIFGGDALYLEAADASIQCFMTGGGNFSGQHWNFVPASPGNPTGRLWAASSSAHSLGIVEGQPRYVTSTNGNDQRWTLTRLGAR